HRRERRPVRPLRRALGGSSPDWMRPSLERLASTRTRGTRRRGELRGRAARPRRRTPRFAAALLPLSSSLWPDFESLLYHIWVLIRKWIDKALGPDPPSPVLYLRRTPFQAPDR